MLFDDIEDWEECDELRCMIEQFVIDYIDQIENRHRGFDWKALGEKVYNDTMALPSEQKKGTSVEEMMEYAVAEYEVPLKTLKGIRAAIFNKQGSRMLRWYFDESSSEPQSPTTLEDAKKVFKFILKLWVFVAMGYDYDQDEDWDNLYEDED